MIVGKPRRQMTHVGERINFCFTHIKRRKRGFQNVKAALEMEINTRLSDIQNFCLLDDVCWTTTVTEFVMVTVNGDRVGDSDSL